MPREPERADRGSRATRRTPRGRGWATTRSTAAIGALSADRGAPSDGTSTIDGLIFREVVSVTTIEGGIAGNVVPDRVEATVNFRYAPTRTPAEAEQRLRELISFGDAELTVIAATRRRGGSPSATRWSSGCGRRVVWPSDPKQAWTPVAEFASVGVDAINFGPGDPQYAHRDDERVDTSALVRSYEVLRAFLAAKETEGEG